MQSMENLRTSPDGIFTSARSPSLLSNWAAPPAGALFRFQQRFFRLLLRNMVFVDDGNKPPRSCIRIKALQSHRCLLPSYCLCLLLDTGSAGINPDDLPGPTNSPHTRSFSP